MMTDKQLEEKKREFYDKFCVDKVHPDATLSADDLWSWIERLVEEVESEAYKKGLIDQSIRDVTK